MSDVDCNKEMRAFHDEKVTLKKKNQDEMRTRRNSGRTRLANGLEGRGDPVPRELVSQGSYAMRTMIQDDANDYDIDDGAYFREEDLRDEHGNAKTPLAAREMVCEALKLDQRLKLEAEVKKNCVRQEYPEGFHIDVPVYRVTKSEDENGQFEEVLELASGTQWSESDARAVTKWFNDRVGELNAGDEDGSQLRRVTKLTKKLSKSRDDWKDRTTSGICITKLVYDHFVGVDKRDDKSLRETWRSINEALSESTQIQHPVLDNILLAGYFDPEVTFFRNCLGDSLEILRALDDDDCGRKKARETWDRVFDTSYFSNQPDNGGDSEGKKSGTAALISGGTARRHDGGGRFG